jgi:hypothetical protein
VTEHQILHSTLFESVKIALELQRVLVLRAAVEQALVNFSYP